MIILLVSTICVLLAIALIVKESDRKQKTLNEIAKYEKNLERIEKEHELYEKQQELLRPKLAVFIGDSYSAGAHASQPSKKFTSIFSQENNLLEYNYARGGTGYPIEFEIRNVPPTKAEQELFKKACGREYCADYYEVLSEINIQPDFVFISGGRNNGVNSILDSTIPRFLKEVRKKFPRSTIFVTSPIGDATPVSENITFLRGILKRNIGTIRDAYYIDLKDPLLGNEKLIADDGVHPNDLGMIAIANELTRQFRKTVANS